MKFHETSTEYMTIVCSCTRSFIRVSSVIEELLPFDCVNFYDFSVLSHNFVNNGCHYMKVILNIYDYSVVMYAKYCQDILCNRGVIVL